MRFSASLLVLASLLGSQTIQAAPIASPCGLTTATCAGLVARDDLSLGSRSPQDNDAASSDTDNPSPEYFDNSERPRPFKRAPDTFERAFDGTLEIRTIQEVGIARRQNEGEKDWNDELDGDDPTEDAADDQSNGDDPAEDAANEAEGATGDEDFDDAPEGADWGKREGASGEGQGGEGAVKQGEAPPDRGDEGFEDGQWEQMQDGEDQDGGTWDESFPEGSDGLSQH